MDVETEMTREEAAAFFREFADKLEGRGDDVAGREEGTPIVGEEDSTGYDRSEEAVAGSTRLETMTVIAGGESSTVVLPERLVLDVEVGSRSGLLESGTDQHVTFQLAWEVEEVPEDDSIEVV